jgi:hypothetical protein
MRRAAAAVLVTALVLAGCGGGGGSTSSVSSSTSADRTSSAEVSTSTAPTTTPAATKPTNNGGQKPPQPSTPEATVQTALTAQDPELACGLYSGTLLKSAYGNEQGCIAAIRSGGSAKSVKIVSSKTSGSAALVVAVPSGGPSSGEKLTYTLTNETDGWRLDDVKSNVKVGP